MSSNVLPHPRRQVYYWKCDRPAAFHGTTRLTHSETLLGPLQDALQKHFCGKDIKLRPASGQGNHVTFVAQIDEQEFFVRVDDGPEGDDYMEVETRILNEVRELGLPTPQVLAVDATRQNVPFAWQVMELIEQPDLNHHYKLGNLDLKQTSFKLGESVACWQEITPQRFGLFNPQTLRLKGELEGFHETYSDYFHLNLERHLTFLEERKFLDGNVLEEIRQVIAEHSSLLDLKQGCLVHKDLALWNILGSETDIVAFIDWDDAISGDPMDDLSLLGCFYNGEIVAQAFAGYASKRPLPEHYKRRFWLHLLRNMIVKTVIRVGAGYFERNDGFFLIGAGSSGADLAAFTRARLEAAVKGLRENLEIEAL